jgi:hypothetical protein
MSRSFRLVLLTAALLIVSHTAFAQDPVPPLATSLDEPIGPFVIDARGTLARFKQDPAIATTLGLEPADLPTRGLGLVVGAHFYPVRGRNVALGLGGELLLRARASRTIPPVVEDGPDGPTIVTRMSGITPQVSLNFGKKDGWSYVSGGIGWANLTTELQDDPFGDADGRTTMINYGGGARWFAREHVAFTIDLRFYSIGEQAATVLRPAFAKTTVMIFSAGIGLR